jgi:hypothetical protein
LLQRLADQTGGLAAFISVDDDFGRQAQSLRRKLRQPALSDVSVQIDGVGVRDVEPASLASLYETTPVCLYGRYTAGGDAQVTLKGKLNGGDFSKVFPVRFPDEADGTPEIQRMWAWRKIDRLLNAPHASAADIDQVIRLGEQYSVATEYTSFIVLENDAEYARWKIDQRNAVRLTQDRDAQATVATQLKELRRKTPGGLGDPANTTTAAPAAGVPSQRAKTSFQPAANDTLSGRRFGGAMDGGSAILVILVVGVFMRSRRKMRIVDKQ